MRTKIDHREDINPEEGERKYGTIPFAETTSNQYPIDTSEHTRAAWRSIHHWENAYAFTSEDLEVTKNISNWPANQPGIEIKNE